MIKKNFLGVTLLLVATLIGACGVRNDCCENCNCVKTEQGLIESKNDETQEIESEQDISEEDVTTEVAEIYQETTTPSKTDTKGKEKKKRLFYNKIKDLYLSGEWDGKPTILDSHKIEFNKKGQIVIDGDAYGNCLDLCGYSSEEFPLKNADSTSWVYVPGEGAFVLEKHTLTKYVRGKKVSLKGGSIKWKGMKLDLYDTAAQPWLFYDAVNDKIFLETGTPTKEQEPPYNWTMDESSWYPAYLYVFPDYNVSKIEFIQEFDTFLLFDDKGAYYDDYDSGVRYRYCEKDKDYRFVVSSEPID